MTAGAAKRIGVVTVSRSDYGHLRPVLEALRRAPDLELLLLVAGMHLASEFGLTVRDIEADGFPISARVEMLGGGDTPEAVAAATGRGVAGFGEAFARLRPDVVVVLGDRFEMLAAAVAALPFALPVAHIHGGEVSEGAVRGFLDLEDVGHLLGGEYALLDEQLADGNAFHADLL